MKYGTVEKTKVDADGNSVTTVTNYMKGAVLPPIKTKYTERRRVKGKDEEYIVYLEFSDRVHADKGMLDPSISLDMPKLKDADHYDVLIHYTRFEQ